MKALFQAAAIASLSGLASVASANVMTFDYANISNAEEGAFASHSKTVDGLMVTATGLYNGQNSLVYLEPRDSDNRPAGLGVCHTGAVGQPCSEADDNVNVTESLVLTFETEVTLEHILFRKWNHNTTFFPTSKVFISVDGGAATEYGLQHDFTAGLLGTSFAFHITNESSSPFFIQEFTARVPEPATLGLLGLGIAAMGMARRRTAA